MVHKGKRSDFGVRFYRKRIVHTVLTAALILIILSFIPFLVINWQKTRVNEREETRALWEQGDYGRTFAVSREALAENPLDYFLLVMHGFSSYQLAVAQINSSDTLAYLDACIWALRKALLNPAGAEDGRVHYVLGKAYYYKGTAYADLAAASLEQARRFSFEARDIPEYLGLAYAALRKYRESVAAFSLALRPGEGPQDRASDILLLAIARSYAELGEAGSARSYLLRCVESSRDSNTVISARLLLGDILGKAGDAGGAEAQYEAIIAEGGDNAEAHYRLGELYAQTGDSTRARAEWRKAYRIDPAHRGARTRLNIL
jgi:tetratricopeptide (TPR) repeat protein